MAAVHAALVGTVIAHRALALLSADSAGGSGSASSRSRHVDVAMALADLTLLLLWALSQSGLWRPVTRAAFPERLLAAVPRGALPGLDVLVATADPDKEPPLGVVNTVVSAMALDYPGGALSVYLSDDAGSPLTLLAARKAYAFARAWVPFCRRHSVQCPWPDRYFAGDDDGDRREDLAEERTRVKKLYDKLKEDIEAAKKEESISGSWSKAKRQDHDAYVEIISTKLKGGGAGEDDGDGEEEEEMPALVYVAREKRRSCPHHFKAGALNALLRVSGVVSNASYLLVLDCDMACNSRASAMEAMCFLLDRRRSRNSNLAFVQFPQIFHNLSDKDIYANELRYIFGTRWFGLDGVRGPLLSGTGFYVRRDALYGATPPTADDGDDDLSTGFGHSDRLLEASLRGGVCLAAEPESLAAAASCAYEAGTAWGDGAGAGFMYQSVVEDYLTGYQRFFSRGWTSAYCYPYPARRPAFLGSVPTNLNDVLVQNKRWMSGMLAVGISSRHSPLACRPLLRASLLQAMAYAYFGFAALYAVPVLCYATLPQLCFLRGVPLFTPCPAAAAAAAFASSLLQHLVEVSVCAATTTRRRRSALRTWWNEQRFWVLKRPHGPAPRLRQRRPGAARRARLGLPPHRQGRRPREALRGRRLRFHGLLHAAAPCHHALRAQRRRHRRRHLQVWRIPPRPPAPAAVPHVLRRGAQLPAPGGDVPPAGSCQGSAAHHRALGSLGSRAARRVRMTEARTSSSGS